MTNNYILINKTFFDTLISKMNSKTFTIIKYLTDLALKSPNHEISIKYKDIETNLHIGHTCVGDNMRLLQNLHAIEKIGTSHYKINNEILNVISFGRIF